MFTHVPIPPTYGAKGSLSGVQVALTGVAAVVAACYLCIFIAVLHM